MRALAALLAALACGSCVFQVDRPTGTMLVTERTLVIGPKVLCVTAHPDDETTFAATLFKIGTHLEGACDIAVITNGEGGFKYSTLAERLYGLELTDEEVGRAELPAIRRTEMFVGCALMAVRRVFFLDQPDHRYSQDPAEVLAPTAAVWSLTLVRRRLESILLEGEYDFVFTLAPVPETHGHHQAATILALEAVERLPREGRPVVLCARVAEREGEAAPLPASGLEDYPITRLRAGVEPFVFDRTQTFGHRQRLDYRIVVNWVIAAHKSQGTMQLAMNRGDEERFWLFELNPPDAQARAARLFEALRGEQFEPRTYTGSAGTNAGAAR